ncbi:MAG: hypothetical protein IJ656_01600 [Bacilli bacterium]|nr:hypothetical protein [Bacilli bacterium]
MDKELLSELYLIKKAKNEKNKKINEILDKKTAKEEDFIDKEIEEKHINNIKPKKPKEPNKPYFSDSINVPTVEEELKCREKAYDGSEHASFSDKYMPYKVFNGITIFLAILGILILIIGGIVVNNSKKEIAEYGETYHEGSMQRGQTTLIVGIVVLALGLGTLLSIILFKAIKRAIAKEKRRSEIIKEIEEKTKIEKERVEKRRIQYEQDLIQYEKDLDKYNKDLADYEEKIIIYEQIEKEYDKCVKKAHKMYELAREKEIHEKLEKQKVLNEELNNYVASLPIYYPQVYIDEVEKLIEILEAARADTLKEAIAIMIDDDNKLTAELRRQIETQKAREQCLTCYKRYSCPLSEAISTVCPNYVKR